MLAITLGDPYSVNCELLMQCLGTCQTLKRDPVVLVGSYWQFQNQLRRLGLPSTNFPVIHSWQQVENRGMYFLESCPDAKELPAESLTALERGKIAMQALHALKNVPSSDKKLAVVTAPIDKADTIAAGFDFPGQTEFFASLWQGQALMLLAGPRLRVATATNHIPISKVATSISKDLIYDKLKILCESLVNSFGIASPRIGVCGLNPHAGDRGQFGHEDDQIIAPAIAAFKSNHPDTTVTGPLSADTVFYRAYHGSFDAVLAVYHDQGLGPLKLVHFDDAINVTCGLRHVRVSPDHGPARDLFFKKKASPLSMQAAIEFACEYLDQKTNEA